MIDWPWGKRAIVDEHGVVDDLPDDAPVQYWICLRVDEPWTWKVLTNQHRGQCAKCQTAIIYRVSEKTPTSPDVQKICKRCAERMIAET